MDLKSLTGAYHSPFTNTFDFDISGNSVRLRVLTAASIKVRAFWDIVLCDLTGVDQRFIGVYYLHYQGDE
jgi:hypothetical protein